MLNKCVIIINPYFLLVQEISTSRVDNSGKEISLDFSWLDNHKCRFCNRLICNCWAGYTHMDDNDDYDDYYNSN